MRPRADIAGVGSLFPSPAPVVRPSPAHRPGEQWPAYRLDAATEEELSPPDRVQRMARGQAMSLLAVRRAIAACSSPPPPGPATAVVVGTAWAEESDEISFLETMVQRGERGARPARFVNSVHNALAAQVALVHGWRGENHTFTHDTLSFESALWQGERILADHRAVAVVVCGVDALADFDELRGHLLGELHADARPLAPLASQGRPDGALPGEGAAALVLVPPGSLPSPAAQLLGVKVRGALVRDAIDAPAQARFLDESLAAFGLSPADVGLLVVGADGDPRLDAQYAAVLERLDPRLRSAAAVYRQATGAFATASGLALALAVRAVTDAALPAPLRPLSAGAIDRPSTVVLYHLARSGHHAVLAVGRPG